MTLQQTQRDFFSGLLDEDALEDVPEAIARSWRRLRDAGLGQQLPRFRRPEQQAPSAIPETLIHIMRRVGPKLRLVSGDPDASVCALFDADGVMAAFDGGEQAVRKLMDFGWSSQLVFTERHVGTNAVDLAIRYREPQVTAAWEHTSAALHDMSVYAFPLKAQNGGLLGCMALITLVDKEQSNAQAIMSLASMLMEAVIEADLSRAQSSQKFAEQRAIADAMKDGTMVVNRLGVIEYMNAPAGRILRVDPNRSEGRKLADVLGVRPIITPVFETGVGYSDEEVRLKKDGVDLHLIDTAVPIKDGGGRVLSVVNTFREFKRVAQVAQKFGGNQAHYSFEDIVGRSPVLIRAVEMSRRAAAGVSNVLITGESGTGKELFAQGIHLASPRASGPFVAVNCAALPRDLIEAELFGYMPGSFTGANKSGRPGKFEIASGGTIFLDEISEMPLDVQAKLLRVLQEREVVRVGGFDPVAVDVRFVAAMNRDVRSLMAEGGFREDLFYRINVIEIPIPALRERSGDVRLLANHYMERYARVLEKPVRGIIEPVMRRLENYPWPGNVRELQNTIERMVNFADGDMIGDGLELPESNQAAADAGAGSNALPGADELAALPSLAQMEKKLIEDALQASGHNVTKAAEAIEVTKPRFYRMVERYGIRLERGRR